MLDVPEAVSPASTGGDVRIGVALGGGSARGYAHIGALASLERHGYAPDVIVGTSFGAVVGALYATGRGVDDLIDQAEAMRRRDVFPFVADFGLHRAALFNGRRLESYFERLVDGRHFSDLRRRLLVVTTDIDTGERVTIESGPLAVALRASASLPGVFAPTMVDGRRLIDGGIGSPVPLDTLCGLDVDVAIGIGAGMQARDSRAIRAARRIVGSKTGRDLQRWAMDTRPRHAFGRLGRAIAYAAESWMLDDATSVAETGAAEDEGAGAGERAGLPPLEVHTRPPIHWLNFHRAGEAIEAGGRALDAFMPVVQRALAGVTAVRASDQSRAALQDALAQ
ncbi:MAG TPA: patatin-like phospholipase family protein [Trueperaceae bacterium]|nr:patatin-like phospholipase family protein [Trueperaceae bacterium]